VHVKAPSPLLGFNNNVRHKGRVFHIQTEDSGVRHPHVITHLFADGGRILKTTKTSYSEHLGQDRLADTVRQMMQEQHKAMFIALRDGAFDYLFDESAAGPSSHRVPQPAQSAPGLRRPSVARLAEPPPPAAAPPPSPTPPAPSPPPPPPSPPPPPPVTVVAASAEEAPASRKRTAPRPTLDVDTAALHGAARAITEPAIDLDLDALERAAAEAQTPFIQQIHELPPPPATVTGQKRASPGSYSVRASPPPPPPAPPSAPRRPSPRPATPRTTPAVSARYAPSRPASIFATTRPQEGSSIFGEDLISEKSLDEVILGYLAEDLDAPGDKK
jgi:hypothetical protein